MVGMKLRLEYICPVCTTKRQKSINFDDNMYKLWGHLLHVEDGESFWQFKLKNWPTWLVAPALLQYSYK